MGPSLTPWSRENGKIVPTLALLVLMVCALVLPPAVSAAAQDVAPLEVASGPLSERTMSFAGRVEQTPDQMLLFGFLTRTSGLAAQDLFVGDSSQVDVARLTFSAELALEPPTNRADTSSFAGDGTLRVYLAPDGGADWSDAATFSAGDLLAEYDLTLRQTLQRQAPQVGVLVGDGALSQTVANTFSLGEATYRFGAEGLAERLRFTGALAPEPTAGSSISAVINGHVEITSRGVTVVQMGQVAAASTPVPEEPTANAADCALEPWLGNATTALALANEGVNTLDLGSAALVDPEAMQTLADQIDAAIAALRESDVPADAADANRLLVTALSTTSRGLRATAQAVAAGDEATFTQATAALADGQSLLTQAQGSVSTLAASCPA